MNVKLGALLGSLGSMVLAASASAASGGTCDSLRSMAIPNVAISSVEVVSPPPAQTGRGGAPAAAPAGPALPEYCRVKLLLTPDVRLATSTRSCGCPPTTGTASFMAVGNGGFGGSIQGFGDMQIALRLGYATAGNRHRAHNAADGPNGMFALGHPEKIVDFAYRAMHEMTVDVEAAHSGSSTAGRSSTRTTRAARPAGARARWPRSGIPDDYDGIIAGALANRHIHMHTAGAARSVELARHPDRPIPAGEGADGHAGRAQGSATRCKKASSTTRGQCTFDFSKLAVHGRRVGARA